MTTETAQNNTTAPNATIQLDLAADTLFGDVRDRLVAQLIGMDKPWDKLSEFDQRRRIDDAARSAREFVREAVRLIAAKGFRGLDVSLGKFSVNEGTLKADLTCPSTNENLTAINGLGTAVLVLASPLAFYGERREAKPEPDQREMDLKAGEEIDPETGEITTAEDRLSMKEFQEGLEKAAAETEAKKARRGRKAAAAPEMPSTPAREPADA